MGTLKTIKMLAMVFTVFGFSNVTAGEMIKEPTELLIKFDATGSFSGFNPATGETSYAISAKGVAPKVKDNGIIKTPEISDDNEHSDDDKHSDDNERSDDDEFIVTIKGAEITFGPFDPMNPPPIVNFDCRGCTLTFPDGSVLTSDSENVPLIGRALFVYGPVAPNPTQAIATIRMMGCAGLRETANRGRHAGMVGSICFNGVFNFDVSDPTKIPATLTGSSNCTIVLHTPMQSLPQ